MILKPKTVQKREREREKNKKRRRGESKGGRDGETLPPAGVRPGPPNEEAFAPQGLHSPFSPTVYQGTGKGG